MVLLALSCTPLMRHWNLLTDEGLRGNRPNTDSATRLAGTCPCPPQASGWLEGAVEPLLSDDWRTLSVARLTQWPSLT